MNTKPLTILSLIGVAALIAVVGYFAIQAGKQPQSPAENETATTSTKTVQRPFVGEYAPIAEGSWRLERFTDEKGGAIAPNDAYRVSFSAGTLSGQWCNTMIAPYTVTDDTPPEIRFSILQRSKMLCSGNEMRPEDAFVKSMARGFIVSSHSPNALTLEGKKTGFRFDFTRAK